MVALRSYYLENMLDGALKPWARKYFGHRPWTFQQHSAPLHSARASQEWLKQEVLTMATMATKIATIQNQQNRQNKLQYKSMQ